MRTASACLLAALVALGLSACGDTVESIERDAKIKHVCEENGGRVYYDSGIRCSLATKAGP